MRHRISPPSPGGPALVAGLAAAVAVSLGGSPGPGAPSFAPGPGLAAAAQEPSAPDAAGTPGGSGTDSSGPARPAPEAGKAGATVLATVNGAPITRAEFDAEVERLPEQYRSLAGTPDGRRQILDNLILKRLLWARAREQGLDRDPKVRAQVEAYAQQAAVAALVSREVERAGADIPDAELKAYYDGHPEEFTTAEAVRASHILVETEAEAQTLRKELAAGKDFSETARQTSKDTGSAARGGDLGFFTKERMVPEFAEAAFALQKVGDLSPVVKTQFGYHLIKLTDRRPAGVRPFAEVKDPLEAQLRQERQQAAVDKLLDEVRGKAEIKIDDARLAE